MSIDGSEIRSRRNVSVRRISAGAGKKDQQRAGIGPQCAHDRLGDLPFDRLACIPSDIPRLDREGAAGALDHFCGSLRVAEQPADARAVERRRHHQQLEILAQPLLHVAGEREAEIGVERALVELVEQDGGDALERGIVEDHAREDAFGHDLDAGCARHLGAEADAIARPSRRPPRPRSPPCARPRRGRRAGAAPARGAFAPAPMAPAARTSGTRVVLPAPGGATSTAAAPRAQRGGQFRQRIVDGKGIAEAIGDDVVNAGLIHASAPYLRR